ncbi:hypothetical protein C5167_019972 [Papaver somniferum]|uniref:Uncharacterized protein n=1 Tax=Papaver somniferum TaxID=3469 RepID=A0A4Y7IUT8_PAPSO|nr:hypothetical protein C5167_019972 [Papaver somniferum]
MELKVEALNLEAESATLEARSKLGNVWFPTLWNFMVGSLLPSLGASRFSPLPSVRLSTMA